MGIYMKIVVRLYSPIPCSPPVAKVLTEHEAVSYVLLGFTKPELKTPYITVMYPFVLTKANECVTLKKRRAGLEHTLLLYINGS